MNKTQKSLIALLGVLLIFFGFVIVRVGVAKPASTVKVTKIQAGEYDSAVYGQYYPLQYASYMKNQEMADKDGDFGGNKKGMQHSVKQPEILVNFKGMAFSKDYSEDRGHYYAMEDLMETKRIGPASKGACITCKTPYLEKAFKEYGWGYASKPLSEMIEYSKKEHGSLSCAQCHDPETMDLRVINPAFHEAMQRKGIDVSKASREDMRSYVCGQCHVEYYFEPGTFKVVFPWDKGMKPAETYAYYADTPNKFAGDWEHPDSKVQILKAQHPDFETWSTGTHGKAGVSCADCHMPYMRKDGQKYSSHWMTSPMRHLEDSCSTCHTQGTPYLKDRIKTIQANAWEMQHMAGMNVAKAHEAIKKASEAPNADQAKLAEARELVRKSQWYWDIVAAESSMGFHNPDQVITTCGQSNEFAHKAIEAANKAAGINIL